MTEALQSPFTHSPSHGPLHVLWRDEHLVAIHKPAGWLVHRTGLDAGETRFVVQTLRDQLGQYVWPVHRLDKGTCGVLVLALNAHAARGMSQAFKTHALQKRYLALVRGFAPAHTEVNHPLRLDDAPPTAPVQSAHTQISLLARADWPETFDSRFAGTRVSLVQAMPSTGRRHQIRRHLKHMAHPIIGDATHGKGPLNRWWAQRLGLQRLWLHAYSLAFQHPITGKAIALHSPLQLPAGQSKAHPSHAPAPIQTARCTLQTWQDWQTLFGLLPWHWEADHAAMTF